MKAVTALSCTTGAAVSSGISNGRVQRHRDGENAEIQMYISKLKDLVPFMPKNRKLSKLEVIQHVIDYICDLQSALESNPDANNFDAAAVLGNPQILEVLTQRQPLGVRASPNTILSPNPSSVVPQNSFHSAGSSEVSPASHNTEKPSSS